MSENINGLSNVSATPFSIIAGWSVKAISLMPYFNNSKESMSIS